MALSPRTELLAIQKKIWRRNRDLIEHSILVKEPGFDRYEADYRRAVVRYRRVADQDEMNRAILDAGIVYVGDYHTCNQSQRSFLRILKAIVRRDRRFMVGIELIHARHQAIVDRFLSGRIGENTFLKRIRLKEHWIFDLWDNFKPLFDFCRYHRIPMYAIEAAGHGADLAKRDRATARLIAKIVRANPDRKMFVFIGDLHIAPQHLPADVREALGRAAEGLSDLILYENSEPIYWRLAERGLDDAVEVVRVGSNSFCRMHTPPVVCQRSYLNWLEHEEGEIDYADAKHDFLELVDRICGFLRIDLGAERDNVEIFTCGDLSFLKRLKESRLFTAAETAAIKRQILSSESYYVSKARFVYLANLSLNHAAEEAAHFIKHVMSGDERPREIVDAFYANILHEALGFFGSKLVNHKRKCSHERDFKNLLTFFATVHVPFDRRLEQEAAQLVVEYKRYERRRKPLTHTEVFRARMDLFVAVTHALGYMLGDRMYYALISRRLSRAAIRDLFCNPWREEGRPFEVYRGLLQKLRDVKMPRRM